MSIQGDNELRDLVSETLENAGVLAKIRAELRASVFLVLEEHEAFKGRSLPLTNKPLKEFLSTQEGVFIVNLVREFLEYFGLEFTINVFDPETQVGKDYEYVGRNNLAHDLKLNSDKKVPLIAQILQESKVCFPGPVHQPQKEDFTDNSMKKEKIKEDKKSHELSYSTKSEISSNNINSGSNNNIVKIQESGTKEIDKLTALTGSPPPFQNHVRKPDSLKLAESLNQMNLKPPGGSLSSLSSLPPLGMAQNQKVNPHKQVSSDIKALLDLGSGGDSPEHNYEDDFQQSGSERTSKGTNRSLSNSGSEVEEEMSAGNDEQSSGSSGKSSARDS